MNTLGAQEQSRAFVLGSLFLTANTFGVATADYLTSPLTAVTLGKL